MEVSLGAMVFSFVLVAVAFQCTQVQIASAVECTLVSGSTCRCILTDGSGEIDLSPLFAGGEMAAQGPGFLASYLFTYDACKTVPCGNPDECFTDGGCLACQNDGGDNIWGIASVNSVLWGDVSTPGYTFTISYENKAQNKKSQVSYTLDTSGGTQFTVTGEQPANTYNMAVSGCFNTPLYICPNSSGTIPCKVDSENPCACLLADGSGAIDLSPIFQGPLVTKVYDSVFLYDACKPIPCGSQCINCSGCQVEGGQGNAYGLGTLSSTIISATYIPDDNWALTVQYSNPAQGKQFSVYYTLESAGSAPVFQYVTEITPSNFVFSLHGCFTTPKSSCKTPKLPFAASHWEQV